MNVRDVLHLFISASIGLGGFLLGSVKDGKARGLRERGDSRGFERICFYHSHANFHIHKVVYNPEGNLFLGSCETSSKTLSFFSGGQNMNPCTGTESTRVQTLGFRAQEVIPCFVPSHPQPFHSCLP